MKFNTQREWRNRILLIIGIFIGFFAWLSTLKTSRDLEIMGIAFPWYCIMGGFAAWPVIVFSDRTDRLSNLITRESILTTLLIPAEVIDKYYLKPLKRELIYIYSVAIFFGTYLIAELKATDLVEQRGQHIMILLLLVSSLITYAIAITPLMLTWIRDQCKPSALPDWARSSKGSNFYLSIIFMPHFLIMSLYLVFLAGFMINRNRMAVPGWEEPFYMREEFLITAVYPVGIILMLIVLFVYSKKFRTRSMRMACEAYADLEAHHPVKN